MSRRLHASGCGVTASVPTCTDFVAIPVIRTHASGVEAFTTCSLYTTVLPMHDFDVISSQRVASFADIISLRNGIDTIPSQYVFPDCDRLKVAWVDAPSISAQVVKNKPVGDRTIRDGVCDAVGDIHALPATAGETDRAVPTLLDTTVPNPARRGTSAPVNLRPEPGIIFIAHWWDRLVLHVGLLIRSSATPRGVYSAAGASLSYHDSVVNC